MKKLFYASKKFLNLDGYESDASIFAQIRFWDSESPSMETSLKIRDCHKDIHLTIEPDATEDKEEDEFENSMFKLDTLIRELMLFKEACISARSESERRLYARQQKEEEAKKLKANEEHQSDSGGGVPTPERWGVYRS